MLLKYQLRFGSQRDGGDDHARGHAHGHAYVHDRALRNYVLSFYGDEASASVFSIEGFKFEFDKY